MSDSHCTHEGETSPYCTKCWAYRYESPIAPDVNQSERLASTGDVGDLFVAAEGTLYSGSPLLFVAILGILNFMRWFHRDPTTHHQKEIP